MTTPPPHPPAWGAGWRAAAVLAWVGGVALQLRQPVLWPRGQVAALAALVVASGLALCLGVWVAHRRRPKGARGPGRTIRLLGLGAAASAGFVVAALQAECRLADALDPAWEGRDLRVAGRIAEMPQWREDGVHFVFEVEGAESVESSERVDGADTPPRIRPGVPSRLWLFWGRDARDDPAVAGGPAAIVPGQRWRLPVRLRLPHGAANPEGFDAELWLFEQGLRATGSVRGNGERLGERFSDSWAPVERARQWVRDRILLAGLAPADAGVLAALAVGDQAAIDGDGWERFRDTGVAHLMSISGLHITMLAWLGGAALGAAWRRSERAALAVPTPVAARWGGVFVAWTYSLLAGAGVPAQRTVVMLIAVAVLRGAGLQWPPPLVALAAMVPVTALDPWALLQPGFWLSFGAVVLLMVSEPARAPPGPPASPPSRIAPALPEERLGSVWRAAVSRVGPRLAALRTLLLADARAQVIASFGLLPVTLIAFQQISVVGLLANLFAVPWVTLVVTPLTLAGVAWPGLWALAGLALKPLMGWLAWLDRWPWAQVHVAVAPGWALAAGVGGGMLLMLPLPLRWRALGGVLVLPLLWPPVARPPTGQFELLAADIGQGTAVLVRTRAHLLLFDTGPRFSADNDAGRRLLLPLLQARGERRIDRLVLSHRDSDHVGGAQSLIDRLPVAALSSSLEDGHPLRRNPLPHTRCLAGQAWDWDGVHFEFLHPLPPDYRPGAKSNSLSCVLRVADGAGRSALLTGDIEAPQETALVARRGPALRSDILVVPHHGSRTSSTDAFLDAVQPGVAVIQVGYRNRYGHPAPPVLARYAAHRIPVVRTDRCGAWFWRNGGASCTRDVHRRYWQWHSPAPKG